MDELRPYRKFLSDVTRRMLGSNPHLLARWPISHPREARLVGKTPVPVYGGRVGGADEKEKSPGAT